MRTTRPGVLKMREKLDWLESQARLADQQIRQQPEVLRRIYEADVRAGLSDRREETQRTIRVDSEGC